MVEVNNITRAIQSNRINYLEGLIAYAGIDLDALYYIDFVDEAYEKYEETIKEFKQKSPLFRYHLTSGNTEQVTERLDRGLIDFAVIVEPPNLSGTINLAYNGSVFVKEGLGYMLTFDRLIDTGSDAHLFKRVDCGSCRTDDLRFFADVEF